MGVLVSSTVFIARRTSWTPMPSKLTSNPSPTKEGCTPSRRNPTLEEAERAAGMGSYVKPGKRKMETLIPSAVELQETLADVKKRAKLDNKEEDEEGDIKM